MSVGMFETPGNSVTFGFIEKVILNDDVALCGSHVGDDVSNGFVHFQVYVEQIVDSLLAAVKAEKKDGEEQDDDQSDQ
jgi:hypothetical protein